MTKKSKIGVLSYIASTKGVKFTDQPETWYNPASDEAKEMVKPDYKGKEVEIILSETPHKFVSMILLEVEKVMVIERTGSALSGVDEIIDMTEDADPVLLEEDDKKVAELMGTAEEEKVPQTPPKEEDMVYRPEDTFNPGELKSLIINGYTKEVFKEMESTKLETATKGPNKLTYASWAESWGALKRLHPTATFKVHENEGMPMFYDRNLPMMGAFVKVTVTIMGLGHTVHLPVMNHSNKSLKLAEMSTFDVNKNIQRALTKAIAYHGIGLYVFKGEDYPEEGEK